jgi:DNA-binding NarL/FixJ family response regulator
MTQQTWRVLIADDHAVTRQGIVLLSQGLRDVEVAGEASTGREAIELCRVVRPNLVLMDLDMPEMGGVDAIRVLKDEWPDLAILVLTVHEDGEAVFEAIRAGASGYLAKSCTIDDIRRAFDAVRAGGAYLTSSIAGTALDYLSRKADEVHDATSAIETTTPREREVLALLGRGLSARRIASRLGISERTVNTHIGHIYRRFGVNNRVDAVREGMRLGLVESPR